MIIDFHTHIFPDNLAQRAIDALEKGIKNASDIDYKAEHNAAKKDLLHSMDVCGIDISVTLPVATKPAQVQSINEFAQRINMEKRLVSFAAFHPYMPDTDGELEKIAAAGFRGIKIHPESQELFIDSPEAVHIINKAYELGLLVVLHTGYDLGFPPPSHCSPKRLKSALEFFDGSNVIAAHFGGFRMWEDVYKYLAGENIYLDTSLTVRDIDKELFLAICEKHTAGKILYGSDSPWEKQNTAYEYMKAWNVPDMDRICYKNAQKLLNINYS